MSITTATAHHFGASPASSSRPFQKFRNGYAGMAIAAALAFSSIATAASSVSIVVPSNPSWVNPLSENGNGTGYSAITGAAPRSGNGSLELHGDRTRFFGLGNPYDPASNLGLLSTLTDFRFDWMVAVGSAGTGPGAAASYSPALRIHIWDGNQRSELIWENAYNGGAAAVQGTWYSSGSSDYFWRHQAGLGDSLIYNRTISQWSSLGYSPNAYISAISVGVGSTAGAGYHAFADNVVLSFGTASTTYNFEATLPDLDCPIISNIQVATLVAINTVVDLTANVSDATTGGSTISSVSYNINPVGSSGAMAALDGNFDEVSEDVTKSLSFATAGVYTITVSATDSSGNSCSESALIVAYDPSAGFVTGGGWIDSPVGAFTGPDTLQAHWNQGFAAGTEGWLDSSSGWYGQITALADGTARVQGDRSAPFTRFDGYHSTWPGTWIAEIDVYLDPSWVTGRGFDYSVAASGSDGNHLRDFIFHVGVVENYGPVTGKALLVNGSNNADFTTNPYKLVNDNGGNYHVVSSAGWYTLQHVFYDAGGYLAVDLKLLNSSGAVVWSATRSTLADTIPGVVGGNRYGWFTHVQVDGGVIVDNHQRFEFGPSYPNGKANFGFVSKYKKGATIPDGSTEFVFKAGGLNFHSSSYKWLVVNQAGKNAQFKGDGTINGAGSYGFMIWATDNAQTGTADTFRIHIWDKNNGDATVYDNGDEQPLGGGNIIVHTAKK